MQAVAFMLNDSGTWWLMLVQHVRKKIVGTTFEEREKVFLFYGRQLEKEKRFLESEKL